MQWMFSYWPFYKSELSRGEVEVQYSHLKANTADLSTFLLINFIPHVLYWGQTKSVRYRDEILRPVAVPLVQQRNLILQQDNARPHVARVCQDFLANNNIAPLAWPPYSPDLTPIEHMWDELDRRVRKRRNPPATLAHLRNALIDEWNNIPMRTVNALVNSIQRRIRAATAARGGAHPILIFSLILISRFAG